MKMEYGVTKHGIISEGPGFTKVTIKPYMPDTIEYLVDRSNLD